MEQTKKAVMIVLLSAVLILSMAGCASLTDAAKNAVKNAISSAVAAISAEPTASAEETQPEETQAEETQATEESAEPEATSTKATGGEKGYWPSDIPDTVPKFNYGAYNTEAGHADQRRLHNLFHVIHRSGTQEHGGLCQTAARQGI